MNARELLTKAELEDRLRAMGGVPPAPPRDNGGSAFPNPIGPRSGMSLRDWFAGMALQGELACQSETDGTWPLDRLSLLARRCHLIADAMLAERAKEGVS